MNKTVPPPQIRTIHKFLFEKPFDQFPNVDHALFVVLALIVDGNTEKQIISVLKDKVHQSSDEAILIKIADKEWALYDEVGDDRVWHIQPLGKRILDDYISEMKRRAVR